VKLQEAKKDYYRRLAKEQGYKSRAAFKLLEANKKYSLIRTGDRVIDFGAAPGGWLQVSSDAVGERGMVLGIDLDEININRKNVKLLRADVYDEGISTKIEGVIGMKADVILSDLSPDISGAWELDHNRQIELSLRVFELCGGLLKAGGNGMFKVFDGERLREVRDLAKKRFRFATLVKPDASRRESSELFIVGLGFL
jgi:23S rRNA (uridine2552-2'-O)-methyltransferase